MRNYGYFSLTSSKMNLQQIVLFLELILVGATATELYGSLNTTIQIPNTNLVESIPDNKSYVVSLTRDTFNHSTANRSHIVMFFAQT